MRHRSFILVAALVLLLIAGAVAAYAYDSGREDRIAEGVTVAGVDVGGHSAGVAREVVRNKVQEPLERPVEVTYGKRSFTLSPKEAEIRADVGGMVDEALQESRDGNILSRVARDLTGGKEDARIPARVSYSKRAVARLVNQVEKRLDRPAQDARLNFPSLTQVKEQDGLKVDAGGLQRRVQRALLEPSGDRTVEVPARVTKPKVTRRQLVSKYPTLLVVDRGSFQLRFYKNLRLHKAYTVAVGQVGYDTPAGLYSVQNKAVNPAWNVPNKSWAGSLAGRVIPGGAPNNPLKARWLGIYDGAGIHGTDAVGSLGSAASHGCIRMAIPEVIELYDQVPVGAPIYIA